MLLDRIKQLCKEKGVTQVQMEKDIDISNGASSKWKVSSPSPEILYKLADYFNVSVDYLMGKSKYKTKEDWLKDIDYVIDTDSLSKQVLIEKAHYDEISSNERALAYYINSDTREMAQKIFENKNLKLLFDAASDANEDDLKATADYLLFLKNKERGNVD